MSVLPATIFVIGDLTWFTSSPHALHIAIELGIVGVVIFVAYRVWQQLGH